MAKLGDLSYDEEEYKADGGGGGTLPDGTYNVEITESKQKKWDDGGVQLGVTYKVIDGDFADRLIFDNLQVVNKSDQVQGIARAQLRKLTEMAGHTWPLDDDQNIVGLCLTVTLKTKTKGDKSYQNITGREDLVVKKKAGAKSQTKTTASKAAESKQPETADAPW